MIKRIISRIFQVPRPVYRSSDHTFPPMDAAITEVDVLATPSELQECLEKTKMTWEHLGAIKPHFSVITDERYLPEKIDESMSHFRESGVSEVGSLTKVLKRHGLQDTSRLTCVELGCGVGRVTHALGRNFLSVDAYDISQRHLDIAKMEYKGKENVHFHLLPAGALPELVPCDVFYSKIVLQHNPPPIIYELLRLAFSALKPRGIAVFQVPTYRVGYKFKLSKWLADSQIMDMEMHCIPQWVVFDLISQVNCMVLEVREDNATGAPERFVSNTFVVRKH